MSADVERADARSMAKEIVGVRGRDGGGPNRVDAFDLSQAGPEAVDQRRGPRRGGRHRRLRAGSSTRALRRGSPGSRSPRRSPPSLRGSECPVSIRSGDESGAGRSFGTSSDLGARPSRRGLRRAARGTCRPSRPGNHNPAPGHRPADEARNGPRRRRPGRRRRGRSRGKGDVVDRPESVRRRPDGEDSGPVLDLPFGGRPSRAGRPRDHPDDPDRHSSFRRHCSPGVNIRVVVEFGHHDLVAGPDSPAERPGQVEGQARHVVTERDLIGLALRKSATARRASAITSSVSRLVGKAQWVFAL